MPNQITSWNIAHKYQNKSLLRGINAVAGLAIFFFGYDQGMMGGVNNAKDYIDTMGFGFVDSGQNVHVTNSLLQGGIVSVYYLGTLCGAFFGGWLGEKLGRINSIAIGTLWAILGATLQCSSQNKDWMICGIPSLPPASRSYS
jgi:MFS family permease